MQAAPNGDAEAFEQVATLLADAGDTVRLDDGRRSPEIAPHKASSSYFAAASAFLRGRADERSPGRRGDRLHRRSRCLPFLGAAKTKSARITRPVRIRDACH